VKWGAVDTRSFHGIPPFSSPAYFAPFGYGRSAPVFSTAGRDVEKNRS
jgi:hypothetical protein